MRTKISTPFLSTLSVYVRSGYRRGGMFYVGTSGWQYASWKGTFYPRGLPQRAWLGHYATVFPTVEVNNSFYRLPEEGTFDKWRGETPRRFLFVVKASRYITHVRRLRDCRDPVELFWSRARRLGDKLGPVLFQLPPNFRADPDVLREFLRLIPREMRAAFEFRDDSWRQEAVIDLLEGAGAAWVLADRPGWRVPDIVTGGWSYVRFHQGRDQHPGYTRDKLRRWADRLLAQTAADTFVFFNNDQLAAAPADGRTLIELLQERGGRVAQPAAGQAAS
jgi:uncharacterized protein YecE (DUF72 family)